MADTTATEDIMKRAEMAAARENYDYAITLMYDLVIKDPQNRKARAMLRSFEIHHAKKFGRSAVAKVGGLVRGLASRLGRNPKKALASLEAALRDNPTSIPTLMDLAEALKAEGYVDQAIDTLEAAREIDNKNKDILRELVNLYESAGDYRKAQMRAQEYVKLDPYDQSMAVKLKNVSAKLHIEASQVDKAEKFLDQVKDVEEARDLERGERLVRDDEELEQAVKEALINIRRNPQDPIAYTKLGDLYQQRSDFGKAMEAYKKAYAISKDFPTREKMGDLAIKIHADRVQRAEKALAENPDDPKLKAALEKAKQEEREFHLKEYEFRVKAHPTDLRLRYRLAIALFMNGLIDRAIAEFQHTVQDPKTKISSLNYLGLCFMKKDLPDSAVNQFKQALEGLRGGSPEMIKEVSYNLGTAYEAMGELQQAYETYQQIFETDIGFKDVAQRLPALRQKIKGG